MPSLAADTKATLIPALRYRDAPAAMAIRDEDYGGRAFSCFDLEGHLWSFGTYDPWRSP